MSMQATDTSVRAQVVVDAPLEHAFSVFTEGFGSFKPPEHNLLPVEIAETVFEPRVGGEAPERTRVELEHRNLERHGEGWEAVRDGVAAGDGWPRYLQRFAEVVKD
jgi:hypothetical protein